MIKSGIKDTEVYEKKQGFRQKKTRFFMKKG